MEPFLRQRINCRIHRVQYTKFTLKNSNISQSYSSCPSPFCLKHSRTKKAEESAFSSNDTLIVFLHVRTDHDGGKQFIGRIRCKTSCGIWKWWSENHTVIYLFKTKIFYGYLNRHIFMRNTEKGTTVTPSRRIDKCPTLGHRFSDKFLTTGTDKMTNAREGMGTLGINRGIDWAIQIQPCWPNISMGCLPFTTNSRKFRLGCKW